MTSFGLRVYHAIPALRPALATAHGYVLRYRRYSRHGDRLAQEALEREHWPADRWRCWKEEKLAAVLDHAARQVPYYRKYWNKRRRAGDRASWEVLQNWPILEKRKIRENPYAFLADDRERGLHTETTSGTTGQPIRLWFSRETTHSWYALFEARLRLWNGVNRHDRWTMLGAQLVAPASRSKPPFWVWNGGLNQLYLSAYHVSPQNARLFLDAMRQYRTCYLLGHSSGLEVLAREALRMGYEGLGMKVAFSSSEPLNARQRGLIGRAFECPVRETYGMTEIMAGASDCEHGRLHSWPEAAWLELDRVQVNESGNPAGDLISTGFVNRDMPLIRYRIGDRAAFSGETDCPCGRTLPIFDNIEGRIGDMLMTRSGRRISPSAIEIVFDTDLPIQEAQIVQETLDLIRVRYVPADGFDSTHAARISDRIRSRLGDVQVEFEKVSSIARSANSKFRAVICRIPPASPEESAPAILDLQTGTHSRC